MRCVVSRVRPACRALSVSPKPVSRTVARIRNTPRARRMLCVPSDVRLDGSLLPDARCLSTGGFLLAMPALGGLHHQYFRG